MFPVLDKVTELFENYGRVPVMLSETCDDRTPVQLFEILADSGEAFMLESVNTGERTGGSWGRYSFIGFEPSETLTPTNTDEGFVPVKEFLARNAAPVISGIPKFAGGLAGYFAYDSMRMFEKRLRDSVPDDDLGLPDYYLSAYDTIVAYDHLKSAVNVIISIAKTEAVSAGIAGAYAAAETKARALLEKIGSAVLPKRAAKPQNSAVVKTGVTERQFCDMVNRAKQYIEDGDIFQVVLSRRFEIENPPDSFEVYRRLRVTNPSPYLYFFRTKDFDIVGASPEMLVGVDFDDVNAAGATDRRRVIKTKPIAGSIRRGATPAEDNELARQLLDDPKERAEHTMLVDLGRNDVGRVSKFGTVEVGGFMQIEKYSTVTHLVADVSGELRDDFTALDAIQAVLPAGTLSGAPKVRAMEIIDELESRFGGHKRCLYGGAVGYIGFDGVCDTCIAIRTVLFRKRGGEVRAYVGAGAGIVADSVPEKEYAESQMKANAILKSIEAQVQK